MTIKKLYEKYERISKKYETVSVQEILIDLNGIMRQNIRRRRENDNRQKQG